MLQDLIRIVPQCAEALKTKKNAQITARVFIIYKRKLEMSFSQLDIYIFLIGMLAGFHVLFQIIFNNQKN